MWSSLERVIPCLLTVVAAKPSSDEAGHYSYLSNQPAVEIFIRL